MLVTELVLNPNIILVAQALKMVESLKCDFRSSTNAAFIIFKDYIGILLRYSL